MATEFDDDEDEEDRFVGTYLGTVVDNADPLRLGRVRVLVPGLVEPFSAWAIPNGTLGGGSPQRGFYDPPDKLADVTVWFHQGDIDFPIYSPGHWGLPDAGAETPAAVLEEPDPAEATKIKSYETPRFQMVWDGRDGKEVFRVLDKVTGDFISMEPSKITVKSATLVVVDAPKIFLGGDDLDENPITGEGVALAGTLDSFSGTTAGQKGTASTKVFAKKL